MALMPFIWVVRCLGCGLLPIISVLKKLQKRLLTRTDLAKRSTCGNVTEDRRNGIPEGCNPSPPEEKPSKTRPWTYSSCRTCHSDAVHGTSNLFAGLLLVLASQAFGVFLFGLFTTVRLALSTASLWGVISFSISGMSFPVMAMNPVLQALANLFPLRHYFLIYVDLALNGYPLIYAWHSVVALMLFMLLPFFILKRLRTVLLHYVYIP